MSSPKGYFFISAAKRPGSLQAQLGSHVRSSTSASIVAQGAPLCQALIGYFFILVDAETSILGTSTA